VAAELADADAVRALARTISAGEDDVAFTLARALLERSLAHDARAPVAIAEPSERSLG
jgi:hypothetical protein